MENKQLPDIEKVYSDKERALRNKIMQLAWDSYSWRENPHPQFDGMSYLMYHETNEKADNAYIPPKKNKIDKRVVSGVTRQKDNTLVSVMLGMNFKERVRVFDEDDQEMLDMGYVYTDLLKKAQELDKLDDKLYNIYRQLFAQGNVFVRERFVERFNKVKNLKPGKTMFDSEWTEVEEKEYDGCESEVLDPRTVLLGNIFENDIQKQPYIFIVTHANRDDIEAIYKDHPRWKYVPQECTTYSSSITNQTLFQDNISLFEVNNVKKVEVIEYFNKNNNEYNVILNGVLMFKEGFPMSHPFISPSGEYPITKGDLNAFLGFAYGKSIPADTKFAEEILNQQLRLMIIKSEQSAFVPRGNLSGKLVNESIYYPSMITSDVSPKDLPALIENPGITAADFNFSQYIDTLVSNMSISKNIEGMAQQTGVTATQYLDQVKQSFKKLGISIDSVIKLRKGMAEKKLYNLIANWTNHIDTQIDESDKTIKKVYRKFSVEREVDGKKGMHVIKFTPDTDVPEGQEQDVSFDIYQAETELAKTDGTEYMLSFVNPDIIKSMKYKFYIEVVPGESDNTTMSKEEFKRDVIDAMNIFGPEAINMEANKQEYAKKIGKPFEKFFNPLAELQQPMMQQVSPEAQAVAEHNQMQKAANADGAPTARPQDQMMSGAVQGLTNTKTI